RRDCIEVLRVKVVENVIAVAVGDNLRRLCAGQLHGHTRERCAVRSSNPAADRSRCGCRRVGIASDNKWRYRTGSCTNGLGSEVATYGAIHQAGLTVQDAQLTE